MLANLYHLIEETDENVKQIETNEWTNFLKIFWSREATWKKKGSSCWKFAEEFMRNLCKLLFYLGGTIKYLYLLKIDKKNDIFCHPNPQP